MTGSRSGCLLVAATIAAAWSGSTFAAPSGASGADAISERPAVSAAAGRRYGTDDLTPALRAMQTDPFQNPGMLFVEEGAQRWGQSMAPSRSCADCHGADGSSMRGVAARYPRYDEKLARPVSLGEWIVRHLRSLQRGSPGDALPTAGENSGRAAAPPPAGPDNPQRLLLEVFVSHQSAGEPIAPPDDPRLGPFIDRGAERWRQRLGQLDLSCAQCHDERAGRHLAGTVIPQGHPTGYPVYRLEWQGLGSLQRRLRNCLTGVRAEPFAPDSIEAVELELYLMRRAAGMSIETPAVRP